MLNVKDIKRLYAIFENEGIEEIEIRNGESSLRFTIGENAADQSYSSAVSAQSQISAAAASSASQEAVQEIKPSVPLSELKSKWIGFFTRLNTKTGDNYIKLRDIVKKGDIVGHVSVLGVLQDLKSEVNGKVKEVLVEEGQPIEYGQPVMRLEILD